MADITQIQVGSNTYNIRDDTARAASLPSGGSKGQVLKKASGTNYDVAWETEPSTYPPSSHTHDDRYYTESEVDTKLNAKANSSHTHDDRYYTESEMNTKLNAKVSKSGDTMTGDLVISTTNRPSLRLKRTDGNDNSDCYIYPEGNRLYFNEIPSDSSTYREIYQLPTPSTGLSGNKWFSILTSKNVVTVAQGGTGKTTYEDAWNVLEESVDSDWKTLENSSVFLGTIYYRKIGNWVEVHGSELSLNVNLTTSNLTLGTLGSGYRPKNRAALVAYYRSACVMCLIYSGGNIYINSTTDHSSGFSSGGTLYIRGFYFVP